jgi:hypothetical protein
MKIFENEQVADTSISHELGRSWNCLFTDNARISLAK